MNSQQERKQCFPFNNGFVYIKYGCSEKMVNVAVGVDEREDILQPSRSVQLIGTTSVSVRDLDAFF